MYKESELKKENLVDLSLLYRRTRSIAQAYASNNLVLMLGSGVSKYYSSAMPTWMQLLDSILTEVEFANNDHRDEIISLIKKGKYTVASEALKKNAISENIDADRYIDNVAKEILKTKQSITNFDEKLHLALIDLRVPIVTTNFDNVLEDIVGRYHCEKLFKPIFTYENGAACTSILDPTQPYKTFIFKIHGSLETNSKLILDESDYLDLYFRKKWPEALRLLRHIMGTKMVIFLGYSMQDPEVMLLLREATRYTSSFQHLALIKKSNLTPAEVDSLKVNYKVDPILYHEHSELPLIAHEIKSICKMLYAPIWFGEKKKNLGVVLKEFAEKNHLDLESAIVFGSFARYGFDSSMASDIDVLILTSFYAMPHHTRIDPRDKDKKTLDITVMSMQRFTELLSIGDPFVSSIFQTGFSFIDIKGRYKLLSRGFEPRYDIDLLYQHLLKRYRYRWIQVLSGVTKENRVLISFVYQWLMSLMQLGLLCMDYRVNTTVDAGLLGNSRFLIHEFAKRCHKTELENYLLGSIFTTKKFMKSAYIPENIFLEICSKLNDTIKNAKLRKVIFESSINPETNVDEIKKCYINLKVALSGIWQGLEVIHLGYGSTNVEDEINQSINTISYSAYDGAFFVKLYDAIKSKEPIDRNKLMVILEKFFETWVNEKDNHIGKLLECKI